MVASGSLFIAEQCIDRQARTDLFRGRQVELATGRVLLHAIDSAGRSLCGCGCGREHLTPAGQPWQASYLPHLPRCRGCAQLADAAVPGQPGQDSDLPAPASGVDIRTAHGTAAENDARATLREVLAEHDLRRWMFTDLIMIDETTRSSFSHPMTLRPAPLVRRPVSALSLFLHEQLHWMEGPATEAAAAEFSRRWPDPPPPPAGGGDPRSTWTT